MEDKNIRKEFDITNGSLLSSIKRENTYTVKNTLERLRQAINSAQDIDYPNRVYLLEIYYDIMKDPHLASLVKHRKERVKSLPYALYKKSSDKLDNQVTDLFKEEWFEKFMVYCLDAIFYGNSLIELLNTKDGIVINLIPRKNVIPEFRLIKTDEYLTEGDIDYTVPIYYKNLIEVNNENNSRNLGEFISVVKEVLVKQEVLLNWAQYTEIFGQPIRVATSDSNDPVELSAIHGFLKDLGRSGYMIKNSQTELTFEQGVNGSSNNLFKEFEGYLNEQISKAIIGGTMITDSGSSRSQSEVHERSSYLFTKADIRFIENIVNKKLIPLLLSNGILKNSNIHFKFKEPEILTVDEKLKIDTFLVNNFEISDIEYFEERYGVKIKSIIKDNNESDFEETLSLAAKNRYDINLKLENE